MISLFLSIGNGYNILFLGPMNGMSHTLFMSSFVQTLISRGHRVTFLTSNSLKHLNLANYTEILVDPPLDLVALSKRLDIIKKLVFMNET